jgi:hypothetical protein
LQSYNWETSEAAISPRRNGYAEISAEEHQEKKRKTDCGGWRARLGCRRIEIENAERAEEFHSRFGDVFPLTANRSSYLCGGLLAAGRKHLAQHRQECLCYAGSMLE